MKRFLPLLPKGKALDIAMGEGRNSLFLAAQGFQVEGLERNPGAIQRCQQQAKQQNLTVQVAQVDLENHTLKRNAYDLIICFYYLQRNLIPQMKEALKKGGMMVYETFLIDQHIRYGNPKHSEYCFQHNELLNAFRPYRILYYEEGLSQAEPITVRLIAVK